jgi:acetoin utilization deacetylase AcuC-like enzyme
MKFFAKKNNTPKVVYSHDYFYSIDDGPLFDVMRFKKIRDRLITMKILRRKDILIPEMVAYDELHLVHTPAYVQSIRDPMQVAPSCLIWEGGFIMPTGKKGADTV